MRSTFSPARANREIYLRRVQRVFEHIDAHLDERLELEGLAQVAGFSSFHFHRLFLAWTGETLGAYLTRRRVEVAAMRLAYQPRLQVIQVALDVGFGSPEAFSRAFKSRFGVPPSRWAASSKLSQANGKRSQAVSPAKGYRGGMNSPTSAPKLRVSIIDRPAVTVACLPYRGPFGPALGKFWQTTVAGWMEANGFMGAPRYGISHDDPLVANPNLCRYDAGVQVPADFVATGDAIKTTLPAGRYAIASFYGNSAEIGAAWAALLRDWLPSSGYQLDNRPCFEHYPSDGRYDPKTQSFEANLCAAITPLT